GCSSQSTFACWRRAASSPRARRGSWSTISALSKLISGTARQRGFRSREARMSDALLSVSGLTAGYGATEVLRGIDLEVAAGKIIGVLRSNRAGKSTLNRTISGVLHAPHGSIRFAGSAIEREKPATIVARGLIHVPEGRCVFPNLTIKENLDVGSYRRGRMRRGGEPGRGFCVFSRRARRRGTRPPPPPRRRPPKATDRGPPR